MMDSPDSNNSIKKVKKKMHKHRQILTRETGVTCCENPTKHFGICNVGQANGLNEETLIENFHEFGNLDRILLIPGKSCAFLSYKNVESSKKAFDATNAKLNIAQNNKPIYLSYVECLPNIQDDKVYDRLPPGLTIIPDFITEEEEKVLLSLCQFEEGMKHRQVQHFGYEFRYDINNVDKDKPLQESIPQECNNLWKRLSFDFCPDQLTVNQYKPGQGIPSHIDTHSAFEDPILSLSLNSSIIMEFKKEESICVLLPPRSLAIMSGECRYAWTHGITPRKFDYYYTENGCQAFERKTRVSYTFRKIRKGECDCEYKTFCDSQKNTIGENLAKILESQHVHDVYEKIATHFSETRHQAWSNVLNFVENLKPGSILVDVGCGNGKYFNHNKNIIEIGTDRSFNLNEVCKQRGFEIFTANCLNLPLQDSVADAVISIAVIHHLSTEGRRFRALSEIFRILRVGGEALIYVWAKQQIKNLEKSAYIKQDRKNRKQDIVKSSVNKIVNFDDGFGLPVHTNRTDFNHSDVLVPWKLKNQASEETFLRFYHVFEEGELDRLCQKLMNVDILKSYYDQGNYCVLIKKTVYFGVLLHCWLPKLKYIFSPPVAFPHHALVTRCCSLFLSQLEKSFSTVSEAIMA